MTAGTAPEKNQVNLGDPDFWLRDDAESALAELRATSPVVWQEHPECGRGFWAILKYQHLDEVLENADRVLESLRHPRAPRRRRRHGAPRHERDD